MDRALAAQLCAASQYIYRSDTNEWVNCASLTIDGSLPINQSYLADFAALVAMRLCPVWPATDAKGRFVSIEPSASLQRLYQRANLRLMHRPGVVRDQVQASYF